MKQLHPNRSSALQDEGTRSDHLGILVGKVRWNYARAADCHIGTRGFAEFSDILKG
jgi:hypothetical protein